MFGKNVGSPPSHEFSDINVHKHSVDTCELFAILLLLSELRVETRLSALESWRPTISGLWGPHFCGRPVRPNMLNMPKSALSDTVYTYCTYRCVSECVV